MKLNQAAEINFHKGITVHYQEIAGVSEELPSEFNCASGAQWMWLSRILNLKAQVSTISELPFNLVSEVAGAHDQIADPLATQLPDQQLKKWPISHSS
jgi:hypothetical protein